MKILYLTGLLPVVLAACSPPPSTLPEPAILSAVAQTKVPVRTTHHHPVIQNFERREPTDPKPWRELNDEQTSTMGAH